MRKRSLDMSDWQAKEQWKLENAPPEKGTQLQQNYDWLLSQGREREANAYLERMTNNYQYRQGPDGQFYRVDIAEPQVLGSTLPEGWNIEGDGGGNASGPFPR